MEKTEKYYGEVWLPDLKEKNFCVLGFKEDEIYLETNLKSLKNDYKRRIKEQLIFGLFNGLGHVTFLNNRVMISSSGVVEIKIYKPQYTFYGAHFIEVDKLVAKEFKIDSSAIVQWNNKLNWYDHEKNIIELNGEIKQEASIPSHDLNIKINKGISTTTNTEHLLIYNSGFVELSFSKSLNIKEGVENYRIFQKFLLFTTGRSKQFEAIRYKCLSCGEWMSLYFKDSLHKKKSANFLFIEYDEISKDLSKILQKWYRSEKIRFCVDIILENLLAEKISHSRRFTNSISAFEAYSKRFEEQPKNSTLEKFLLVHTELIFQITQIKPQLIKSFCKKIVRTRKDFVHGNEKDDKIFTEFELLYISMLLDYVVAINILTLLGMPKDIIEKTILRAEANYSGIQSLNKFLNEDPL